MSFALALADARIAVIGLTENLAMANAQSNRAPESLGSMPWSIAPLTSSGIATLAAVQPSPTTTPTPTVTH